MRCIDCKNLDMQLNKIVPFPRCRAKQYSEYMITNNYEPKDCNKYAKKWWKFWLKEE